MMTRLSSKEPFPISQNSPAVKIPKHAGETSTFPDTGSNLLQIYGVIKGMAVAYRKQKINLPVVVTTASKN
jgi:hypothetical protein